MPFILFIKWKIYYLQLSSRLSECLRNVFSHAWSKYVSQPFMAQTAQLMIALKTFAHTLQKWTNTRRCELFPRLSFVESSPVVFSLFLLSQLDLQDKQAPAKVRVVQSFPMVDFFYFSVFNKQRWKLVLYWKLKLHILYFHNNSNISLLLFVISWFINYNLMKKFLDRKYLTWQLVPRRK